MIQVIHGIEKVVHHENRIFRWYTDGKVEYCDLDSSNLIFKMIGVEPMKTITTSSVTE